MKHKFLNQALEFARVRGVTVARHHIEGGMTLVRLVNRNGSMSAGRAYKTGSANPQARYIIDTVKRLSDVERGIILRARDGRVFFFSEKSNILYRWQFEEKEWRVWLQPEAHQFDIEIVKGAFFGRWGKATVSTHLLRSGVKYYD